MPVITVSRQLGSRGTEIARMLSREWGCPHLDKESLEEAFSGNGLSRETVERYDEKKPGFWDMFKIDKARYLHLMKGYMLKFAETGNGIIIGRGGQVLFGNLKGVLNVRIMAPMDIRTARLTKRFGCDDRHAERILQSNDYERAGFHKFFFGVNWEDPNLYDLVINTASLSVQTAVILIKSVVDSDEFKNAQTETVRKLAELSLEHDIKTAIIYKEKIMVQFLEITVVQGAVTLQGIVDSSEDLERCEKVAASVPGVTSVKNEIYFSPLSTTYGLHY
ncbi:MAG: cytidylate kinase family protein [Candidatus Omnitrophota bacterium]